MISLENFDSKLITIKYLLPLNFLQFTGNKFYRIESKLEDGFYVHV